ncbi:hypothetical protein [Dactylosporangium sp. NPDC051541]|uniref:hypothetical protein n=1 Tax=Dactylosporangium sp. NPDC051541 TaxID=3363977 RepID=UPI0037BB3243
MEGPTVRAARGLRLGAGRRPGRPGDGCRAASDRLGVDGAAAAVHGRAYSEGLMLCHRADPPAIVEAAHGDDGPLRGAALMGLDHITEEAALAAWSGLER